MKNTTIRQPLSRSALYITISVVLLCIGIVVWFALRSSGTFLSAWFAFLSIFLLLLVWIQMPKKIMLTEDRVLLLGILRMVPIENRDIQFVTKLNSSLIPVFASRGLMGFFGLFYNKGEKCLVEVFARGWNNMIFIKCKSGRSYVVGVDDDVQFLKTISEYNIPVL